MLHGFGMVSECFSHLTRALSAQRFVLAFDLPGHGGSLNHPLAGSARKCAEAVIKGLETRALGPVTLVGHSFGGAVASLVAIARPDLVNHLVLLAPGGFGPEINAPLLRRHAAAVSRDDIQNCLSVMNANGVPSDELIEIIWKMRQAIGQTDALQSLCNRFLDGDSQGVLPLETLADTGIPSDLVWGGLDQIVPVTDGMLAPAKFTKTIIADAGHMLPDEATAQVARIILKHPATA
jgi:pimeloyl-ACP methyl ester carboxylesterase